MIIQGLWVGDNISQMEYLSYSSFLKNGFEYHLYTYNHLTNLPKGVIQKDANEILDKKFIVKSSGNGSLGGFSDLFRWNLILKHGGIYADSDVVCLKPFSTKINVFAGELHRDKKKTLGSTQYLYFEKNHPIMQKCVELSSKKDLAKISFAEIGPKLVQDIVTDDMVLDYNNFNANPYWEWEKVIQAEHTDYLIDLTTKDNVYGFHLWNELWRVNYRKVKKEQEFENNTFIKYLLNKYN